MRDDANRPLALVNAVDVDCKMDKRQHLPFTVRDLCPSCTIATEIDLSDDHYLSYPIVGKHAKLYFCCRDCGAEWQRKAMVTVTLTVE